MVCNVGHESLTCNCMRSRAGSYTIPKVFCVFCQCMKLNHETYSYTTCLDDPSSKQWMESHGLPLRWLRGIGFPISTASFLLPLPLKWGLKATTCQHQASWLYWGLWSAASASPGNLPQIWILGHTTDFLKQKFWERGPASHATLLQANISESWL
jgi:hypothetical protein